MFGSKSSTASQSQRQWAMQALTLDYLIEGNVQPSDELTLLLEGGRRYYERRYVLTLAPAQIQPTGSLTTPTLSVSQWTLEHRGGLVALIPRDEASTQALLKVTQSKTFPFRAVMYVGSYVIRASLTPESQAFGQVLEGWAFIQAKDAEIDCQLPGAQLSGLTAPWLVLNRELMQGYHPA